jgi:hypothetical protein
MRSAVLTDCALRGWVASVVVALSGVSIAFGEHELNEALLDQMLVERHRHVPRVS